MTFGPSDTPPHTVPHTHADTPQLRTEARTAGCANTHMHTQTLITQHSH